MLEACVQYNANEYAFRVRIACCCILFLGTTAHDDGQEHIKIVNPGPLLERDAVKKLESAQAVLMESTHKREEWVAPIPGRPCLTGLYEHENSAR